MRLRLDWSVLRFPQKRRYRKRRLPYAVRKLIVPLAVLSGVAVVQQINQEGAQFPRSYDTSDAMPRPAVQVLEGRASVVDGDTIEIGGKRVRLNGIDAPESAQYCEDAKGFEYPCGRIAANELDKFLAASMPTKCTFVDLDQYGRFVGNCSRADGRSIAEWLVENGQALDWPRYSDGAFVAQQSVATKARRGLWQGRFQEPWVWRAENSVTPAARTTTPSPSFTFVGSPSCNIKGNISAKGERVYHVPGQKFYSQTKISESKGERWFCSEGEAREAGWRKAKR